MYFMMQIMVQIKVSIKRGVNSGAINPEITTALPEKAGGFINQYGPGGVWGGTHPPRAGNREITRILWEN
jgi:hypothetical protein